MYLDRECALVYEKPAPRARARVSPERRRLCLGMPLETCTCGLSRPGCLPSGTYVRWVRVRVASLRYVSRSKRAVLSGLFAHKRPHHLPFVGDLINVDVRGIPGTAAMPHETRAEHVGISLRRAYIPCTKRKTWGGGGRSRPVLFGCTLTVDSKLSFRFCKW